MTLFELPLPLFFGQLMLGVINGAFYAILSLGLAVIFGMLRVINFAHGAQYMLGGITAWLLLEHAGLGFWYALILAPIVVIIIGAIVERLLLARTYKLDHVYALLLTLGIALTLEGTVRYALGNASREYPVPDLLTGVLNLGFMIVPIYRVFVVVMAIILCLLVWFTIEKTRIGAYLRAATEKPTLVQIFGINVPRLMTWTYAVGAGLAGLAGVMATPIYQASPSMGQELIIVVFAIVVIGGVGSIMGTVVASFALGLCEGLAKVFYPEAASTIIFIIMALVLIVRPNGLFGREVALSATAVTSEQKERTTRSVMSYLPTIAIGAVGLAGPYLFSPILGMKVMCFALFAAAFNLLFGYVGLLSFGHAAFFGGAAYFSAYAMKYWGVTPEIALIVAVLGACGLGGIFGFFAIRRTGIYFSMVTLALAQMFFFMCIRMPMTGGEDGIQGVPRGELFGLLSLSSDTNLYYAVFGLFALSLFAIWRVVNSPFGNILKAIRDNEARVISLGYSVERYKLAAFILSAGFAGIAGGAKAIVFQYATLSDVNWHASGDSILMTLIGGIGTMLGPVVGAAFLVTLQSIAATIGFPVSIITGCVFVLCVVAFRRGIVGELSGLLTWLRQPAARQPLPLAAKPIGR